jgi:hypothetical protein
MSSLKQIDANRLNAQHSTGPRSPEGKAAIRFNALKTGIDAQSQVIPGEDPAALALLAAEYYDRYHPATPEVRALVDALVTAEWLQRRFRTLEAQLWEEEIQDLYQPIKELEVAQAYNRDSDVFARLQRRIDAAERTYHRTLAALQKIEPLAPQPSSPTLPAPDPHPTATRIGFDPSTQPNPPSTGSPSPHIGSFTPYFRSNHQPTVSQIPTKPPE